MAYYYKTCLLLILTVFIYSTTLITAESEIWVSYKNDIFEAKINTALFKDFGYYTHMIEKQRLSSLKHKLGLLESRPFWKARNKAEPIFTEEFSSLPKVAFVTVQLNSAERYVFNSSYCTCSVTSSTTCLKLVDADLFPTSQTCETYSPCTKYHCTTTGSGLCQRVQRSVPVAGTTNLGGTNFVDCSYATKELAIPVD